MEDHWKLVIALLLLVVLGLPLASKYGGDGAAQKQTEDAKAAAEAPAKGARGGAKIAPAAAGPLKPPLLNAGNLPNSKWTIPIQGIPVTVTFLAGGQAMADAPGFGQLQGSWSISGADLTVSATVMGKSQSQVVKISGDQIIVNGAPAKRLQ